jgi:microcystin degradation protein MlrC
MRLLIAQLSHETNTFSPVPSPLARFCPRGELLKGDAAVRHYRGTGTCMGGYLDVAARANAEVVVPVAASAPPSGRVETDCYETCAGLIVEAVKAGGFDGILLDLHGAMATEAHDDGEGELLRRIRAVDPTTPIAVALDMHANIFDDIVRLSTVVAGYHEYPHTDMAETARRAGDILVRAIRGEVRPVMAWGNAPMLPHVMAQGSYREPNKGLQELCRGWEESGEALAASLFVGFPHADVPEAGLSALVVTDGNKDGAQGMVDTLLRQAWDARQDFVFQVEPLAESVARAKAIPEGERPTVLLDHYDNCASGGSMDTTRVLGEILRQGLEDVAFFGIFDPAAVEQCIAAGIGTEIELEIGGRLPLPSLALPNPPLKLKGTVKTISAGTFTSRSRSNAGVRVFMGPTVVLDTGRVEIVLLSKHMEPTSADMLSILGIDPRRKRYLAIKSRVHWRADIGRICGEVVECAGLGVCTSEYDQVRFEKVRRPIFPLDADVAFG